MERYSLFTTSAKPYTCGFAHKVFGAAAGELTNLINFFLVIRIFLFSFPLLLFLFLFLHHQLLGMHTKIIYDMAEERTLKEYATPSTEEPQAIIMYPRLRVTTLRLNLHSLTWCSKISFLDHPLRIQICISQLF